MKYIINIVKKIIPRESAKPLGRWNIEYSNIVMNTKIDLANEDHCGPCGQYMVSKIQDTIKPHNNKQNIPKLFYKYSVNQEIV
jgi:hypothetical protein